MSLINCETCSKEIAEQARVCPNCGVKRKIKGGFIKFLLNVTLVFLFILILFALKAGFENVEEHSQSDGEYQTVYDLSDLTPVCTDQQAMGMLEVDAITKMKLQASIEKIQDIKETGYELETKIRKCEAPTAISIPSENVIVLGMLRWTYQMLNGELKITTNFEQYQIMPAGMR